MRAPALVALVVLLLAPPAPAEEAAAARAALDRIEAAAVILDTADLRDDPIPALVETLRVLEDSLATLRETLRAAAIRHRQIESDLDSRSGEIADLLAALQRIGAFPAPALTLHPDGPLATARAGMLLSEVQPALQARVDDLRAELDELSDLRALLDGAPAQVQQALDLGQRTRADLVRAIAQRPALPRRFIPDPEALAALISRADSLDTFIAGLDGTMGEELAIIIPDALDWKGLLPLPVQGTILPTDPESPGWEITTRPRTLVTTPVAGTLLYRGPLLNLGTVVILEPAPDILIILAGLAEVFGETGEVLPAGAPLGLMGGIAPDADAILGEDTAEDGFLQTETLYLEVREGQSPADPATWFAAG